MAGVANVVSLNAMDGDVLRRSSAMPELHYSVEIEREDDGRWIAEITDLPGVMAYGATREEAVAAAEALALRVIADQIEKHKKPAQSFSFACA